MCCQCVSRNVKLMIGTTSVFVTSVPIEVVRIRGQKKTQSSSKEKNVFLTYDLPELSDPPPHFRIHMPKHDSLNIET